MKQIQFSSFGPPSRVARCVDVADVGPPAAWEVVVDVEAFPINPADLAMLAGRYGSLPRPPSPIGMEAAGRVALRGDAVSDLEVGDRVVILANNNWAQRRKVPAAAVQKVPAQGDVRQFAMLKVNPATAQLLLHQVGKLNAGDWVLQNAPLSSVGRCVLQLARAAGLRTVNVVRSSAAATEVATLGGDVAVEDGPQLPQRVRGEIGRLPLRLAFDAVAGPGTQRLAECLSEGGRIVNYGMLSGEHCQLSAEQTIFRDISLVGFWLSKTLNRLSHPERSQLFATLGERIVEGRLQIPIDSCFRLEEFAEAIRRAEETGRRGKVLVTLSE